MDLLKWAENEIELKKKNSDDSYLNLCLDSALKAFKCLYNDNHSGFSIGVAKYYLNLLLANKPLQPIFEDDFTLYHSQLYDLDYMREHNLKAQYQCNRYISLFKDEHLDGTVTYRDVSRVECFDLNARDSSSFCCGTADRLIDKLFPITFPYVPEKYIVYFKNGHPVKISKPDGTYIDLGDNNI